MDTRYFTDEYANLTYGEKLSEGKEHLRKKIIDAINEFNLMHGVTVTVTIINSCISNSHTHAYRTNVDINANIDS